MLGSSNEEAPKKRASRKRAVSSMSEGEMRAPRRRVARKSASATRNEALETPREAAPEPSEVRRKAPTELRERSTTKNKRRKQLGITAAIFIVGIGLSAVVGFSDRGSIDVNRVVEERNERIRAGGGNTVGSEIIPVQNQKDAGKADGGLIPADPSTIVPPAPIATTTASSTATSTDTTASSTDMVGDETDESETTEATTTEITTE